MFVSVFGKNEEAALLAQISNLPLHVQSANIGVLMPAWMPIDSAAANGRYASPLLVEGARKPPD